MELYLSSLMYVLGVMGTDAVHFTIRHDLHISDGERWLASYEPSRYLCGGIRAIASAFITPSYKSAPAVGPFFGIKAAAACRAECPVRSL